jgi:chloride channel 3/4/5
MNFRADGQVAFGAPVGGVLFSLEEVSYYFPPKVMWRSFWCAAVATITLKALNPFGTGSIVLVCAGSHPLPPVGGEYTDEQWAVTYTKPYHHWEYAIFILLGLFGGVYGAIFSRLNITWARAVRQGTWVGRHPIVEVLMVSMKETGS